MLMGCLFLSGLSDNKVSHGTLGKVYDHRMTLMCIRPTHLIIVNLQLTIAWLPVADLTLFRWYN